jgi:plastocyanin
MNTLVISSERQPGFQAKAFNMQRLKMMLIGLALLSAISQGVAQVAKDAGTGGSSRVTATDHRSAANVAVKIDNFVFGPQTITVPVGTTVTWTNSDDIPHTAVSTDGVFKSKVMDTDEKFSYTFAKAGTYPYYCSVHPKMIGLIVVK